MKKSVSSLFRFFLRFRYPVSMPEDIATDLGLNIPRYLTFQEFVTCLKKPDMQPSKLTKFMSREQAEQIFRTAIRKERFSEQSLFSYYFNEGWMEFILQFDEKSRLRRLYIQHKDLSQKVEISICRQSDQ